MPLNKKILLISIIVIVILGLSIFLILFSTKTVTIEEWIAYRDSATYSLIGYCSYLRVDLTTKHQGMNIKIILDNNTIYEQNDIFAVNYDKNIGFGNHQIQIHIENPSRFGFNMEILVSGKATISLFS